MTDKKITRLLKDTYLQAIKNSIDTKMFKNFFAQINGEKKDLMENGNLSCAFFVSGILTIFGLTERIHGTVEATIKDLEKSGWEKTDELKTGSVILWEKHKINNEHKHLGFYIGENTAISNDSLSGTPKEHHVTFGKENDKPKRKVEAIYWSDNLNTSHPDKNTG